MTQAKLYIGTKSEVVEGKLVHKFPMRNRVIDDKGMVYDYWFANGKIVWRYLYSAFRIK